MSVEVSYTSKTALFLNRFNKNKKVTLEQMGIYGVKQIQSETPVLSGDLLNSIEYRTEYNTVFFYTDLFYSHYVELGTFVQSANPFMKRGLFKSNIGFLGIMVKNFRV